MVAPRVSASAPLRRPAPPAKYMPVEAWMPRLLAAAGRWLFGTKETGSLAGILRGEMAVQLEHESVLENSIFSPEQMRRTCRPPRCSAKPWPVGVHHLFLVYRSSISHAFGRRRRAGGSFRSNATRGGDGRSGIALAHSVQSSDVLTGPGQRITVRDVGFPYGGRECLNYKLLTLLPGRRGRLRRQSTV